VYRFRQSEQDCNEATSCHRFIKQKLVVVTVWPSCIVIWIMRICMYFVCNNLYYTISPLLLLFPCCQIVGTVIFKNDNWQSPRHQELGEYFWTEYGNVSPMSHLLGHIKSQKSDQSEVHFIAFKDHADDPQYLTAATLPGTYHQKLDLFKKFSTWHRRKKTSCEGKVRKKIENNSKVIWFHSVFRQILIIENLKGSKRTNCRG